MNGFTYSAKIRKLLMVTKKRTIIYIANTLVSMSNLSTAAVAKKYIGRTKLKKINVYKMYSKPKITKWEAIIRHREVIACVIQEMKPQCFIYFEICNTANFDKFDE